MAFDVGSIIGKMILDTKDWDKSVAKIQADAKVMSKNLDEMGRGYVQTGKMISKMGAQMVTVSAIALAPMAIAFSNAAKQNGAFRATLDDISKSGQAFQNDLARALVPSMNAWASAIRNVTNGFISLNPALKQFIVTMGVGLGSLTLVIGTLEILSGRLIILYGNFVRLAGWLTAFAAKNPWIALIVATGIVITLVVKLRGHFEELGATLAQTFNFGIVAVFQKISQALNQVAVFLIDLILKIPMLPKSIRESMEQSRKEFAAGAAKMAVDSTASFKKVGDAWTKLLGTVQQPPRPDTWNLFFKGMSKGWDDNKKKMMDFYQFGQDMAVRAAQNMESAFSDFVFDGITNGFRNMGDVVRQFGFSVLRMLSDIIARAIMTKVILAGIGGGSGLWSSLFSIAGAAAGGIGSAASSIGSSAGMFTGAANGINSGTAGLTGALGSFAEGMDEVPTTGLYRLHQGEQVNPKYDSTQKKSISLTIHNLVTTETVASAMAQKEGRGVIVNVIRADSKQNGPTRREVAR